MLTAMDRTPIQPVGLTDKPDQEFVCVQVSEAPRPAFSSLCVLAEKHFFTGRQEMRLSSPESQQAE